MLRRALAHRLNVQSITVAIVEASSKHRPFGKIRVGEMPIVPPPAAIANAISAATDARMTGLPMTPPRVLEVMGVIK